MSPRKRLGDYEEPTSGPSWEGLPEPDERLTTELATLLHPGVDDAEIARGCSIIETLMRRKKSWLIANGKWAEQ